MGAPCVLASLGARDPVIGGITWRVTQRSRELDTREERLGCGDPVHLGGAAGADAFPREIVALVEGGEDPRRRLGEERCERDGEPREPVTRL